MVIRFTRPAARRSPKQPCSGVADSGLYLTTAARTSLVRAGDQIEKDQAMHVLRDPDGFGDFCHLLTSHEWIVDPPERLPSISFAADLDKIPQATDGPTTRHHRACLIYNAYFIAIVERPNDSAVRLSTHIGRWIVVVDDTVWLRTSVADECHRRQARYDNQSRDRHSLLQHLLSLSR